MALELEGTLRQKLGVQSGTSARGPWAKQEFIVEFPDGNFTSQACFTAWGQDKVAELDILLSHCLASYGDETRHFLWGSPDSMSGIDFFRVLWYN